MHSDGLVEMTAEGGIHMMPGYPQEVHRCRISGAGTSVVYLRMDRGVSVEQAELKLAECMAARQEAAARRAAVAAAQVRTLWHCPAPHSTLGSCIGLIRQVPWLGLASLPLPLEALGAQAIRLCVVSHRYFACPPSLRVVVEGCSGKRRAGSSAELTRSALRVGVRVCELGGRHSI